MKFRQASDATHYPKVDRYINHSLLIHVGSNTRVRKAVVKYSGLSDVEICKAIGWSGGPVLDIKNLDKKNRRINGVYIKNKHKWKDVIFVDDNIAKQFEKSSRASWPASELALASTILHELVHWGRKKKGLGDLGGFLGFFTDEAGKEFEREAYGGDVSRSGKIKV